MITIVDCAYTIRDDGPPLFLIHEIGASYETWAKTLPVFTPHFNVITYDLCMHGASPKSYGEFSLNKLVQIKKLCVINGESHEHIVLCIP